MCVPGGDEEDALRDALLLQQGIEIALLDELLELTVTFQQVLVHGHGLVVLRAEGAIRVLPLQRGLAYKVYVSAVKSRFND